jgi:putative hydrolase of HD superfamily
MLLPVESNFTQYDVENLNAYTVDEEGALTLPIDLIGMNTTDRLQQQMQFIMEIDKLKQVLRRSYLTDGSRLENDAEHSWHLAMMAVMFAEYAADRDIDVLRTLKMVLIHDLVEIGAGDSFLYAGDGGKSKLEHEQAAADRIFGMLPPDQASDMRLLWDEFEAGATSEAKFAKVLDRLHALLQIHSTGGRTWKEHHVTAEMALTLNPSIISAGSPTLGDYAVELLRSAQESGYFQAEDGATPW